MDAVYVFGDQTADCRAFFAKVFARKDDVLLQSFLERVAVVLRAEATRTTSSSTAVPNFTTIQELVDRYYRQELRDAAVESALMCISQLCHVFGVFEDRSPSYVVPSPSTRVVGLCTGMLAAIAVATADSLTALVPLALEVVRIAFRVGAHVGRVAQHVDGEPPGQPWSTIVATDQVAATAALDTFHAECDIPASGRMWISASSTMSVTLSGPPATKARLLTHSDFFRSHKAAPVPIFGPYHASHLHRPRNVVQIVPDSARQLFGRFPCRIQVCSSVTGQPLAGATSIEVLETAVAEILLEPIKWDRVLDYCTSKAAAAGVKVFAIGPTNLTGSLVAALKGKSVDVTCEDHASWVATPPAGTKNSKREADIAIVGFSGRFPDAADHELFWQLLENGRDVHRPVPPDRFPVDSHTDPSAKRRNTSHTPYGNFIEDPGLFDARFFNMSPREATQTDPMQRLMMTTGYEAMEMAGIVPGRTPSTQHDRIGTFYGQTSDDWREVNAAQDVDTYFISGGVRAFGPGRLNYFFKFSGPSFSVDTACSSSFAAMNVAITSLRAGECDTAFTGGTNVLTNSDIFSGLSRGHFLSKTGSCKTWDNDADGYCRGDGVCTVIMKRVADAVADKDPILGVIRGIGTNHSADAVSITHPCAENQAFLFDKVLKECNVDCNDVNYVEMHGTGTQAGDSIEMESVSSVFAPRHKRRRPDQPLYVGAVKSNIGHGEAVSGVSALIKVLLMLQKDKIPPHTGIKRQINKNFAPDLKERGVNIAFQTTSFPRPSGGKRIVFVNNFSAAGGNTAMLLEDGPEHPPPEGLAVRQGRAAQIVAVSAKSLAAFKKTLLKLQQYVGAHPEVALPHLAYTTTARRAHYTYRAAFAVADTAQLALKLEAVQNESHSPIPLAAPRLAFAYTGQGSQYTAMGKTLYETSEAFRNDITAFNGIALNLGLSSFLPLIDGSTEVQHLAASVVQVGMCCVQMALTRLWASWGVRPAVVIGHSLGEYAALQAAGVLSIADTIYLVGTRARLLEERCSAGSHAMLAVRCSVQGLEAVLARGDGVELACVNGIGDTVLSGTVASIDKAIETLTAAGHRSTKLSLPYAFHSTQVEPILEDFQRLAAAVTFHTPRLPIISPLSSEVITTGGIVGPSYLARHCRDTVNFVGALSAGMATATIHETSMWLEIGSHPICAGMVRSCLAAPTLVSMRRDEDPWQNISDSATALYLAGVNLDWEAFHREDEGLVCLSDMPSYGFDEKNYWLQYTGDWLLYKGDYPKPPVEPIVDVSPRPAPPRRFLSTAVQGIVSESGDDQTVTVVAESDLADPKLWPVIKGHLVNGMGLCPSSLYADQALTLADYAYKLLRPGQHASCNVGTMENPTPLLLKNLQTPESQVMKMTCKVDLATNAADFTVTSNNGRRDLVHAKCVIHFEDVAAWKDEWRRSAYLVQSRIDVLRQKMETGEADKVSRSMAYKLFTALVDYSDTYQGMQSVIFDGPEFEATSSVQFRCKPEDGTFMYSPYCIDSTAHLSGFTVNATVNAQEECYISHGWSSLRLLEPFRYDKRYSAYVKMQPVSGSKMRAGDVWIFDDQQEVVGMVGGLRFQCIPRKLMDVMMPKPKPKPKPEPAPAPELKPLDAAATTKPPAVSPAPARASPVRVDIPGARPKTSRAKTGTGNAPRAAPVVMSSLVARAFDIIATELAVDHAELMDAIHWADLGVDSLMSLTISGRFREDLDLDIDGSIFTDHASVGALRAHLVGMSAPPISGSSSDSGSLDPGDESSDSGDDSLASGITTPDSVDYPRKGQLEGTRTASDAAATATATATASESTSEDTIETIRQVVAEEMEMDLPEITETTDLGSLGMDSLMALTVLGRLREDHDIDLDPTILADNPSLGHLRKALGLDAPKPAPAPTHRGEVLRSVVAAKDCATVEVVVRLPPATSVLLQGNPKTATKNLFLFPDGSGSATSYVSIPAIDSKNVAVWGLNCPFMKDPTNYTCGIEGVSKLYLEEVMRRQPVGPYLLGGWSAGGVVAYEVTRQLADLAKSDVSKQWHVEKLVLIDAPCPIRLEPLPARLHHFFDEIGLLGTGTGKTPSWLLPHFEYSIRALTAYQPELKSAHDFTAPPTLLIWATEGVCGKPGDPRPPPQADDPRSMKWLLENRTDFGANGWDQLLGLENCTMVTVVGNHFTMMKAPVAHEVGRCIREALA